MRNSAHRDPNRTPPPPASLPGLEHQPLLSTLVCLDPSEVERRLAVGGRPDVRSAAATDFVCCEWIYDPTDPPRPQDPPPGGSLPPLP